jgi:urea transport system permease protein
MKYILFLFIGFFSLSCYADESSFQNTLNQLISKNLSTRFQVIEEIIDSEHPRTKFVLQSLLKNKIYYIKHQKSVALMLKKDGKYVLSSLINGNHIGIFSKREIKKIGINNKIRKKIKDNLSILDLAHSDKLIRLKSVKNIYSSINQDTFNILRLLEKTEHDIDVKNSISIAINIYNLDNKHASERIKAIKYLYANLEPIVKVRLNTLASNDSDKEVRLAATVALKSIESKTNVFKILETLFFGMSYGSVLILAAIGLSITFGVMGVINMAHGELIMIGAYTTYVVQLLMPNYIGLSILVAIPAAFIVSGLVGVLIERGIIQHLHGRPLETLLATFGVSLVLQQAVRTIFSPLNRSVLTPDWMSGSFEINGILSLTWNRLYIIAFCLIVFLVLITVLKKTSLGLQVRAVSQDRNMARVMGVRSNWVDAMTFGLGSGIAGIAGVALSQLTNVGPNLGQAYIIDSFMVVVFGGVGNLWGTLIGGFGLGVMNKLMEPAVGAVLAKVLILIFIILFIQHRPKGLFPQKGRSGEN